MVDLAGVFRDAILNPPFDDPVQASAREADAYAPLVKNPYALDDLAISLSRHTPGGKIMDAAGLYPASKNGPLGPSLWQNIQTDNYQGVADQLGGLWNIPGSAAVSGIPLPKSVDPWMTKPLKRGP